MECYNNEKDSGRYQICRFVFALPPHNLASEKLKSLPQLHAVFSTFLFVPINIRF